MPKGKTSSKNCIICDKEISLFAYNRHLKSHKNPQKKIEPFIQGECAFCQKIYLSKIGYSNHIRRCKKNPNRIIEVMTVEGKERQKEGWKKFLKKWEDPIFRLKHSEAMKRAVENHPESYTSSNRGRTKQIEFDGIKFQGQWEVDFYKWAKGQNLNPKRCIEGFKYEWNGERTYFPDFHISSLDLYVEVKGYETDRDRSKWLQFPKALRIIKKKDIEDIRKNRFLGL